MFEDHTDEQHRALFTHDADVYLSISERPSTFGYTLFNKAFQLLGINSLYKPMQVTAAQLEGAIHGLRGLGVRGCGVSMPHKTAAMSYLDKVDEQASRIGAINTIVNDSGLLTGYNTDYHSAREVLRRAGVLNGDHALVLGAGGVARAVVMAMLDIGIHVSVSARDVKKQCEFAKEHAVSVTAWEDREHVSAKILVNCTPIGMEPQRDAMPIGASTTRNFQIIGDLVAIPPTTALIAEARRQGLQTIPGHVFILYQAAKQFELYTGRNDAVPIMREALIQILGDEIR